MIQETWFRQRGYAHFDRSLSEKEALSLVRDPKKIVQHAFWPLIVRPITSVYREDSGNGRRITKTKKRPIAYAAHSDSHIYAYYATLVYSKLEDKYQKFPLCQEAVLAYRAFPESKNNINFAYETFVHIQKKKYCEVIALDVAGFFDTLDHSLLKTAWQNLLGCNSLPEDHYAVFKACTRSYGIELSTLREIFKNDVRTKRGRDNAKVCTSKEFRGKVVPEIKPLQILVNEIKGKKPSVNASKGIPQGLSISAVLANLYMLEADKELTTYMNQLGGIYRRYSDDILLIVPTGKGDEAEKKVVDTLECLKLKIQDEKTKRVIVSSKDDDGKELEIIDVFSKLPETVSYLGFEFDGSNIFVRPSSVSSFMIMANRAIHVAKIRAIKNEQTLKKRKLYTRLTSLGYGKAYGNVGDYCQKDLPSGIPRLGFFNYLSNAEKIINSVALSRQKEQIKNRVIREIKDAENEVKEQLG